MNVKWKYRISGAAAGLVSGLFGGGGGTVLVPLLTTWCKMGQKRAMASCVAVILPCVPCPPLPTCCAQDCTC